MRVREVDIEICDKRVHVVVAVGNQRERRRERQVLLLHFRDVHRLYKEQTDLLASHDSL